ncbi:hypothetical protein A0J61_09536 [Choanephora cucurbitarum]|uniref:F-box domain-containing protein n=1 Tax=Choanephora cucurbitarum TaxID=101091 RepID=A0A1C7MZY8_9FUNG|nr:hypothetical protein A0J61_09536 [Choanephora cucurbitarum]
MNQEDGYQLIQVNRAYHNHFLPWLYHSIEIREPSQFDQLIKATHGHDHVRKISIYRRLDHQCMNKIPKLFPSLVKFFEDTEWCPQAATYFKPLQNLTSLTLSDVTSVKMALDVCKLLPRLTDLDLNCSEVEPVSPGFLEKVSNACPLLETFHLVGSKAIVDPEPLVAFQPAKLLRKLELHINYGLDQHDPWLAYIGKKYPNLRFLTLDNYMGKIKAAYNATPEFYRWFLESLSQLTYMKWSNVFPHPSYFKMAGQYLEEKNKKMQICVAFDSHPITTYFLKLCTLKESDMSAITSARLSVGPSMSYDQALKIIRDKCPRLEHLGLEMLDFLHPNDVNVGAVLNLFPRLTSFCCHHVCVSKQMDKVIDNHPLRKACFFRVVVPSRVFDQFSLHCPNLKKLDVVGTGLPDADINLPNHRLNKVVIEDIDWASRTRMLRYPTTRIRLFQAQQANTEPVWFFLERCELTELGDLRATSIVKLDEKDAQFVNTALVNQSRGSKTNYMKHQKSHPSSTFKGYDIEPIIRVGYVKLVCHSVNELLISKKQVCPG